MSPRLLPFAALLLLLLGGCASSDESAPPPSPPPSSPAAGEAVAPARRDHVLFSVTRADLATQVLPLFAQQVGVSVLWQGEPRLLTLRLTQPVHWEEALSLVCQFTRTHPTRDYQGRVVLKDGWGGDLGDGDLGELQGAPAGRAPRAGQGAGPAWDDGRRSSGRPAGGGGVPQPTGAYSGGDEANRLLRGAGTRASPR